MTESPDQNPTTRKYGSIMIALMWVTLIGILALIMQGWLDKRYNPNSALESVSNEDGSQELILKRNPYGHYVASGQINGFNAVFLLDTGATDVVLPEAIAEEFGLEKGYPLEVRTANGNVTVYTTQLRRVTLGPIELYDVRANINPHMESKEILLGMSFLKQLHLTQVRDQLIISQP